MGKLNYLGFVILLIFISLLLVLVLINPHSLYKPEFNKTFENTESFVSLNDNEDIIFFIEKMTLTIPGEILRLKYIGQLNDTQERYILENLDTASDYFVAYKSGYRENDLYDALFYIQISEAYHNAYPFINCANNLSYISKKYFPLFYYLSYSDKERVNNILDTSKRLENYIGYTSNYIEDNQNIIYKTKQSITIPEDFRFSELKCEEFKIYLYKDYQRQKLFFYFKLGFIILIAIIGIIIGNLLTKKKIKKLNELISKFSEVIDKIINPEKIKEDTIRNIIKTDTLISTFVVFIGIIYRVGNLLSFIITMITLLTVLFLLISIFFGIIALNSGSKKAKKISYLLFILGFFIFIGFFLYIIIFGGISEILRKIGESAQTFLNNSTQIK